MRLAFSIILAAAIAVGCNASEPPPVEGQANAPSVSSEIVLTTLAASAAESLTSNQLCDRAGICGADGQADLDELVSKGLVTSKSAGTFQLTPAGAKYVNQNFVITRSGEEVSFDKRDGQR